MPNTLAHIGINGFLTKSVYKSPNLEWVFLGCILPDVPWILKKVIQFIYPALIGFDLHTYLIVQASLIFSLILSAAFALISREFLQTFLILAIGSFSHLLLDALQIKWANGVHLFAPFSWELFHYGLFWPESIWTYLITALGIFFLFFNAKEIRNSIPQFHIKSKNIIIVLSLLALYFLAPFYFMDEVEINDCHFIETLKNYETRTGKYIELDRKKVTFNETTNTYWIESFDQKLIELNEVNDLTSSKISIKGYFLTADLIEVTGYHENWEEFRDGTSYIGLLIILLFWSYLGINSIRKKIKY